MPSSPKKYGNNNTAIIWNINVLPIDNNNDTKPLFKAVKKAELKILKPQIKKLIAKILKPLIVISNNTLSYPTKNIEIGLANNSLVNTNTIALHPITFKLFLNKFFNST